MGQSCNAKCAESGATCNPNWMKDGNKKALDMQAIFRGEGSNPDGIHFWPQCSFANGCEPGNSGGYSCYYNGAGPYANAWTKPDCNSCNDALPSVYFFCTCEAPATGTPTTEAPTTKAPTTAVPTTEAPTTEAPTTAPTPPTRLIVFFARSACTLLLDFRSGPTRDDLGISSGSCIDSSICIDVGFRALCGYYIHIPLV